MDQAQPQQVQPAKRPALPPIDPKKFVGGENVERLKALLREVDGFSAGVKERCDGLGKTLDLLHVHVVKFGEVVDLFEKAVKRLEGFGDGRVA